MEDYIKAAFDLRTKISNLSIYESIHLVIMGENNKKLDLIAKKLEVIEDSVNRLDPDNINNIAGGQ